MNSNARRAKAPPSSCGWTQVIPNERYSLRMMPRARYIMLNLYHILVDGLFDTVPVVLSFMALAYGSGETDVGLVVSLGTALSTVAGLGTGWISRRFGFSGAVALLTGIAGVGFAGAALAGGMVAAEMA